MTFTFGLILGLSLGACIGFIVAGIVEASRDD